MQAEKRERGKPPPADNRRSADPDARPMPVKPAEGAQTGSEGLGYLKKPANDPDKGGSKRRK